MSIEPDLQPLTGESLRGTSLIVEDGARLDIGMNRFWGDYKKEYQLSEHSSFTPLIFSATGTNIRRTACNYGGYIIRSIHKDCTDRKEILLGLDDLRSSDDNTEPSWTCAIDRGGSIRINSLCATEYSTRCHFNNRNTS